MIDLIEGQATAPLRCSRALIRRFTPAPVDLPSTASAPECVERLLSCLTATDACAVLEHVFGALPLVDAFFENDGGDLDTVRSGAKLGAVALFTPSPEQGWGAAPMVGQACGGTWRVSGEVRIPNRAADGSIVLLQVSEHERRLAWLNHDAPGVVQRGSRTGGPPRGNSPRWLAVNGAAIAVADVSRPVTLAPGSDLYERLESWVGVWSLVAVEHVRRGVRALRRAVRTTHCYGESEALRASQLVSTAVTEVEIEAELVSAAARRGAVRGGQPSPERGVLVLALAAARMLAAMATTANDLREHLGLALDGPLADEGADATLAAHVGGTLVLENELARALGFGGVLTR